MKKDQEFLMSEYMESSSCGRQVKKLSLLYVSSPDEPKICDCCDEPKQCASIRSLGGDVSIICKDCVGLILSSFDEQEEEYSYWKIHFYNMEGDQRWSDIRFHKNVEEPEQAISIVENRNLDDIFRVTHAEPSDYACEWYTDLSEYEP